MGAIPAQLARTHPALRAPHDSCCGLLHTKQTKGAHQKTKELNCGLLHTSKQRSSIVGFSCRHLCVAAIGAGAETCNHDAMSWSRLVRIASCVSNLVHISKQRS